ncbi:MAG: ABC transporter substrate-binding protein [Thermomicrobiales bacterium]
MREELQSGVHTMLGRNTNRRRVITGSAAAMLGALTGAPALRGFTGAAAQESGQPTAGGTIVMGLIQEPGQLNDFFNGQSGSFLSVLAVEPLFVAGVDGEYLPVLTSEVPTLENGGISADFLTVTYRLIDGLTWSDGEPFTAEDIKFTFDVYKDPGSTPAIPGYYDLIESVTVVDPLTAQVKMTQINVAYLDLWQHVLPRHKFESTAVTQEHEQALTPLGTGPFVIAEWRTGDEIVLARNENYREAGKPYLDGITVRVTPEKETAIASFVNGELDFIYFIVTGDLPTLTEAETSGQPVHVEVFEGGASVEWLWLNLGTEGDPATPHPVLGDLAIRQAIDMAIDRQSIIDEVLGGFGSLTGAFVFAGWAAIERPPTPYDPARAMAILDEAGWVPGDGGVREKEGVRASLRYQTIAGDLTRELYQQVVQQNLGDVGIELTIENVPSNTIFGSYEEGGILARGQYDLLMSRDGYLVDPADWVSVFTTAEIPSEANPGGFTYSFYSNPAYDDLIAQAAATLDQAARKALYEEADAILTADKPAIQLYRSASAEAWGTRIKGISSPFFDPRGTLHTAEDWYVEE